VTGLCEIGRHRTILDIPLLESGRKVSGSLDRKPLSPVDPLSVLTSDSSILYRTMTVHLVRNPHPSFGSTST